MPEAQTRREGRTALDVFFCLGCPWPDWFPKNASPTPATRQTTASLRVETTALIFYFFWPHEEGLCWHTWPLIQGPSFMTKGTSPSFPLCIPQNQWHLEYWRFPVVKDLLMQRSPLSARAKQKDRGPGGLGGSHGGKCTGAQGLAVAHVHTRDGWALLSLVCVFLPTANVIWQKQLH